MLNHDKQLRAGSRIPRLAAAFTLAVLVSGCTKLGPDFLRPETDVQKEWMEAETSEFKPVEPTDDGRWWTVFGDPVLDRLVQVAYQQNLTLKSAGVRVSVILMVGAGGDRFAQTHAARTLELLARLPLGAGDIVYLSPFREKPGSAYARRAADEGVRALDDGALRAQYAALRDGARRVLPGATVTRYDIREFVY